jgi:hypothetical protein
VVGITASGSLVCMEWSRARHLVGMVRGMCMRSSKLFVGKFVGRSVSGSRLLIVWAAWDGDGPWNSPAVLALEA